MIQFKNYQELGTQIGESANKVNLSRDNKLLGSRFDFLNPDKSRFTKEIYLNYDLITQKGKEENSSNTKEGEVVNTSTIQSIQKEFLDKAGF